MSVRSKRSFPIDDICPLAVQTRNIDCYNTGADFPVGPHCIPQYGIVFVRSGKGWALQKGGRRNISAGDAFIVFPSVEYSFWVSYSRVYSTTFVCTGLAPVLARAGLTPEAYVLNNCDALLMEQAFERGLRAADRRESAAPIEIAAAVWTIVGELLNACEARGVRKEGGLRAARQRLEENLLEEISVSDLADSAELSRFHFMRAFKQRYGLSPRQYQINRRMIIARQSLAEGSSVKEAAYRAGYHDLCYFSRLFRQKTGLSPTEYCEQALIPPRK